MPADPAARPEAAWTPPGGRVLTVSQLLLRATNALVAEFGSIAVEGEVSSFHHAVASGHMYWTLKDPASEVRCVLFRSDAQRLRFPIADGDHVVVVARPTIYPVRGQFQLQVTEVVPVGRGALYIQFEALKARLGEEGLFAAGRKRPLPYWPRVVGVVTSAEGAAVRDIVSVIRRRAPATSIVLKPVPVQGREAAPEIARAIRLFARHDEVEVLIVGRGGGSLEDLWAFNEEVVVRAIAACPIPIVSAVGHETDTTLADYAADVRAPTPSVAGERVVPETGEIARTMQTTLRRLAHALERQRRRRVDEALAPIRRYGFRRVRDRLLDMRQGWGEGTEALAAPVQERLARTRRALGRSSAMAGAVAIRLERATVRQRHLDERLRAGGPQAILGRGYAIVTGPDGRTVADADRLGPGDRIDVRFARGRAAADVVTTETSAVEER